MKNLKDLELYDLLDCDGDELGTDEYETLLNNKCYIHSDYIGESNKGSIYNIELIHGNDIDIYLTDFN